MMVASERARLLLALLIAISLSDYGLLLGGAALVAALALLWMLRCGIEPWRPIVPRWIPAYASLMLGCLMLNRAAGLDFNLVVFVPIAAYALFSLNGGARDTAWIETFALSLLYFVIIPSMLLEVGVKLNLAEVPTFQELLLGSGDGRLDVLRIKSPFGSPLSLASFAFAQLFYFAFFTHRKLVLAVLVLVVILTGSRTALAASVMLLAVRAAMWLLARGVHAPLNPARTAAAAISTAALLAAALTYFDKIGLTVVLERVLSLTAYDVTADESFVARGETTLAAFVAVIADLPRTFFIGLDHNVISDSAFVTIAAQSGLIVAFSFFALFYSYAARLPIAGVDKLAFLVLFSLLTLMVGDAVVPLISFFYFLVFFAFTERVRLEANSPLRGAGRDTSALASAGEQMPGETAR